MASVLELSKKVDLLSESILEMRKIQDEDKLAEYKDKIGQSYRYYNERKSSTSIQYCRRYTSSKK